MQEATESDLPNAPAGTLEQLLKRHAGLIHKTARQYDWALNQGGTLEYEDLVQAGQLGLARALETFDADRGFEFSTYAAWWVRHYIQTEARNQARTIRVPISCQRRAGAASATNITRAPIQYALRRVSVTGAPTREKNEDSIAFERGPVFNLPSEEPIASDDEHPNRRQETFAELAKHMADLDPQARDILTRRFMQGQSIRDVAKDLGLSREKVTSIANKALARLRTELS